MKHANTPSLSSNLAEEHRQVRKDLLKVLLVNGLLLALLLILFFINQKTGNINAWFEKVFKF